ncbi:CHY zinc finger protein [Fodinisporobacter ferrooxydans]|uniref:CHY zinc finger protein n=1 Tax=Fodinisporobacter ferrooxydans TaxID=2901836 RepID=A0ABY4CEU5_9BACL|nr:CHY zinc finger protein [Alicyclobacillaceae bacterium MYW30-H2]
MYIHSQKVEGLLVDAQTRCRHYSSDKDVIAIKFPCCDTYFPCFMCHHSYADHAPTVWKREQFHTKAILCGVCGFELTIRQYFDCDSKCPKCQSGFNPGCQNHYHLYFET